MSTYIQPRDYGRVRVDEAASGELLMLLRERKDILMRLSPEERRWELKIVDRLLAEVRRVRDEHGWQQE